MDKFQKNLTHEQLYNIIEETLRIMKKQKVSRSDLKIIAFAIRELNDTFKVFSPYQNKRKVTVFGSARMHRSDPSYNQALKFSREMVRQGYMVLTGAGGGIMHAAQEGAGSHKSFGLNINLPFEQGANPVIKGNTKLVTFKYFFTRKLTMVKESDALVLFPGGFGTHDELFEMLTLLHTGKSAPKPVVCVDEKNGTYWKKWKQFSLDYLIERKLISKEDANFVHFTDSFEDAVSHITRFYSNYHSMRTYEKWLLIRLRRAPSPDELKKITQKFKVLLTLGKIQSTPTHVATEPELMSLGLKTLRLCFNQKSFGKLRALVDTLNEY